GQDREVNPADQRVLRLARAHRVGCGFVVGLRHIPPSILAARVHFDQGTSRECFASAVGRNCSGRFTAESAENAEKAFTDMVAPPGCAGPSRRLTAIRTPARPGARCHRERTRTGERARALCSHARGVTRALWRDACFPFGGGAAAIYSLR